MSLTSFRKDGSEVATTVWFALHDGRLLMRTDSTSFKVKRMRRNPSVTVAPCNARGQVKGEPIPGRAVELGPEDGERSDGSTGAGTRSGTGGRSWFSDPCSRCSP